MVTIMNIQAATGMIPGIFVPLWALLHCFFGYVLFRITLAVNGLLGGFFLGAYVMGFIREEPTTVDVWVAGTVGAVLLALTAWFLYRIFFAIAIGFGMAGLVLQIWPGILGAWAWIVAVLVGLLAGVIILTYLRDLVTFLTAVFGAATAVIIGINQWLWQGAPQEWIARDIPLTIGGILAFILLASAGLAVQFRTRRFFPSRFAPPDKHTARRKGGGSTGVRPKFTRV